MTVQSAIRAGQIEGRSTKSVVRHLPTVGRVLFGLMFFVFGLNGFLNFIPPPSTPMPEGAIAFGGALLKTGYMFPLIKGTEVVAGALLLCNRYVALALAVLAPIVVNIVAFHFFLTPSEVGMAVFVLALHLYLAWTQRSAYRPLFRARG